MQSWPDANEREKESLWPRLGWVPVSLAVALLLAVPFLRPIKFDLGNKTVSVWVQTLAPNWPLADEGVFIRTGWDGPTGSFSHGNTYGIKLGHRLLRLDIMEDPVAAAQRRLPKTLAGLTATLDSKDRWLRFCAARALADMGASAQPALPALIRAAERGDWPFSHALFTVSKAAGAEGVPALTNALASTNAELRERTAVLLAEIGPSAKAAVPYLKQKLHDAQPRVIASSAIALWKVDEHTHGAVPVLMKLLTHHNAEIRGLAAAALGEFGNEAGEAVPALLQTLEDTNHQVRAMSARTLGMIGPAARPAIPRLILLLDESNQQVLMWTMNALGQFGEAAQDAIPKLRVMAGREDSGRWALEALSAMGSEAVPSLVEVYQDAGGRNRYFAAKALMKSAKICCGSADEHHRTRSRFGRESPSECW